MESDNGLLFNFREFVEFVKIEGFYYYWVILEYVCVNGEVESFMKLFNKIE